LCSLGQKEDIENECEHNNFEHGDRGISSDFHFLESNHADLHEFAPFCPEDELFK
jgi:hypothetical protein